eukprot:1187779-Prorocentrum_minimum.AAC.2
MITTPTQVSQIEMNNTLTPKQIDLIEKGRWFTRPVIDKFARKAGITALDKKAHYEMEYHFAIGFDGIIPVIESNIKKRRGYRGNSSGKNKVTELNVMIALQELFGHTYDTYMPLKTQIKPCPLRKPVNKELKKQIVENEIDYYMSQDDCLYIPRNVFKAIIDLNNDINTWSSGMPLQWDDDAINRLQLFMEKTFILFLKDALLCALHAGRKNVTYKDLELAEYLCRRTYVNPRMDTSGESDFNRKEESPTRLHGNFTKNIGTIRGYHDDEDRLENYAIVFDGFDDKELEDCIKNAGGQVLRTVRSLKKKLTYLVVKKIDPNSSLQIKAHKLCDTHGEDAITIITREEFKEKHLRSRDICLHLKTTPKSKK